MDKFESLHDNENVLLTCSILTQNHKMCFYHKALFPNVKIELLWYATYSINTGHMFETD